MTVSYIPAVITGNACALPPAAIRAELYGDAPYTPEFAIAFGDWAQTLIESRQPCGCYTANNALCATTLDTGECCGVRA